MAENDAVPNEPTEVVDSPAEPVETPAEPTEPVEPQEPEAPQYATVEQMQKVIEDSQNQLRTWIGRRDKETLGYIGNVINEKISQRPPTETESQDLSTRLLENPEETIGNIVNKLQSKQSQQETIHLRDTVTTVGTLMDTDQLYAADKELGNEVTAEIKSMVQSGRVDKTIPAEASGKLLLAEALSSAIRKRATAKTNPLGNNQPQNTAAGLPPGQPGKKTAKPPKLDAEAQKLAEKFGYSQEDLVRVYGEG